MEILQQPAILPIQFVRKPLTHIIMAVELFPLKLSLMEVITPCELLKFANNTVEHGAGSGVSIYYTGGTACSSGVLRNTYVYVNCYNNATTPYIYEVDESACSYKMCA